MKNVLITNNYLKSYAGSEIAVLDISLIFKKMGYNVYVATLDYGDPIKTEFEKNGIKVFDVLFGEVDVKNFDLVWAHHAPIITQVLRDKQIKIKNSVFTSLSPFEPLESLPFYSKLFDLLLANSQETADHFINLGLVDSKDIKVFHNSVPPEFFDKTKRIHRNKLKTIAVVSNRSPKEVLQLEDALKKHNIKVCFYGSSVGKNIKLITPEILNLYDAVITIGRTIQYCFSLKIPVYCYDIHGGPGWLNEEVYDKAEYYNFSGRGFQIKKITDEIAEDLIHGYHDAIKFLDLFYAKAKEKYNLENNIKNILSVLHEKKVDFSDVVRVNERYLYQQVYNDHYIVLSKIIKYVETNLDHLKQQNDLLVKRYEEFRNNYAYKVGRAITNPPLLIRKILGKVRKIILRGRNVFLKILRKSRKMVMVLTCYFKALKSVNKLSKKVNGRKNIAIQLELFDKGGLEEVVRSLTYKLAKNIRKLLFVGK